MNVIKDTEDLKKESIMVSNELKPNVQLFVLPVEDNDQTSEQVAILDWQIKSFESKKLKIQVYFADPSAFTDTIEPNFLSIKVWNEKVLTRKKDGIPIGPDSTELRFQIESQRVKLSVEKVEEI